MKTYVIFIVIINIFLHDITYSQNKQFSLIKSDNLYKKNISLEYNLDSFNTENFINNNEFKNDSRPPFSFDEAASEVVLGTLGSIFFGISCQIIIPNKGIPTDPSKLTYKKYIEHLYPYSIGTVIGSTIGVYLAGKRNDEDTSIKKTLLSGFIGMAIGISKKNGLESFTSPIGTMIGFNMGRRYHKKQETPLVTVYSSPPKIKLGIRMLTGFVAGTAVSWLTYNNIKQKNRSARLLFLSGSLGCIGTIGTGKLIFKDDGNIVNSLVGNSIGIVCSSIFLLSGLTYPAENVEPKRTSVKTIEAVTLIVPPFLSTIGYYWNEMIARTEAIAERKKDGKLTIGIPKIYLQPNPNYANGLMYCINLMRVEF